jgi:hypothetical protein
VRINEEPFDRKVAAAVKKTEVNDREGSVALRVWCLSKHI